jgi:hypothetical protein
MSLIFFVILLQILVCNAYLIDMLNFNTRRNEENENKVVKIIVDFIKSVYAHNESSQNDLEMVSWLIGVFKMKINKRLRDEQEKNTVYWHLRQG